MAQVIGSARAMDIIAGVLAQDGGSFGLSCGETEPKWTAALEWGKEADDSPMVGAAAYGVGDSAGEAIHAMLSDAGKLI